MENPYVVARDNYDGARLIAPVHRMCAVMPHYSIVRSSVDEFDYANVWCGICQFRLVKPPPSKPVEVPAPLPIVIVAELPEPMVVVEKPIASITPTAVKEPPETMTTETKEPIDAAMPVQTLPTPEPKIFRSKSKAKTPQMLRRTRPSPPPSTSRETLRLFAPVRKAVPVISRKVVVRARIGGNTLLAHNSCVNNQQITRFVRGLGRNVGSCAVCHKAL